MASTPLVARGAFGVSHTSLARHRIPGLQPAIVWPFLLLRLQRVTVDDVHRSATSGGSAIWHAACGAIAP